MLSLATFGPTLTAPCAPARHSMAQHPLVTAAARGRLPEWAVAGAERRQHMARVAALLDAWAAELRLSDTERDRWRAAGYLHDALRDADPSDLRLHLDEADGLVDALLHGPAAAQRLREDGVVDEELLAVVAYHTMGDPSFGTLGRALYSADFLDPGREFLAERRAEIRARASQDLLVAARDVARERIRHQVGRGLPLPARTVAFWNQLVGETRE